MKTILLCLNQLGIGGVETAVLNQVKELRRRKFRVVVLAADGIYRKKIEELGAIWVKCKFVVENRYDINKIEKVRGILREYGVEQVHIHQFDCINVVFPACMYESVPYVAYLHCGITGVYDWFERCYPCYKNLFSLYFWNAAKIVAIRRTAQEENQSKYGVPKEKYVVLRNSMDIGETKTMKRVGTTDGLFDEGRLTRFLLVCRFGEEKLVSIDNAIRLFRAYLQRESKAKLEIVGDGTERNEVEGMVKDLGNAVSMLGARNDVLDIIKKNEVVLALDRCVLESITMKRITVLSGYDGLKGIITGQNIKKASEENFGGINMKNVPINEICEALLKLGRKEINKIQEDNFKFVVQNLDIRNNILVLDEPSKHDVNFVTNNAMDNIISMNNRYVANVEYTDKVYKDCMELIDQIRENSKINEQKAQRLDELENEGLKATARRLVRELKKRVGF